MTKPSSCKSKGREFQKWIVNAMLLTNPELSPSDIYWTSMGSSEEDIRFPDSIRNYYFDSIYNECKHQKRVNWQKEYQDVSRKAKSKDLGYNPVLWVKGHRQHGACAIVDSQYLLDLLRVKHLYEKLLRDKRT